MSLQATLLDTEIQYEFLFACIKCSGCGKQHANFLLASYDDDDETKQRRRVRYCVSVQLCQLYEEDVRTNIGCFCCLNVITTRPSRDPRILNFLHKKNYIGVRSRKARLLSVVSIEIHKTPAHRDQTRNKLQNESTTHYQFKFAAQKQSLTLNGIEYSQRKPRYYV